MDNRYQIPRNSLIWLLASMFAGIAPHASRLPLWLLAVCLICGLWRIMVYRSRWHLPNPWVKALLVCSGVGAVWLHYGTLFGPLAGTALLVLGFCFKLLETHSRRDAFIVVVLGYFVVATGFFFTRSMIMTAYLLGVCFMVTAALIGLNQTPLQTHPARTARRAMVLVLQSLPLMLVLFILVPRVSPLWSLDLGSGQARTGLSDRVTPGDIAELSRSPELAFRVEFEGRVPPPGQRYWRALVMDHYDGSSWSRRLDMDSGPMVAAGGAKPVPWRRQQQGLGERYRYRVMLQPTDQRWLFAMALATSDDRQVLQTRDHRLLFSRPITQPISYQVTSELDYRIDPQLPDWLRRVNLQLPAAGDPRSRDLAVELHRQSSDTGDYIQRVLAFFRQQPFVYTLRPGRLAGERIDRFLFETRRGFCSHYAGAFVFLMRAAGVPARMVTGYQGGEMNPVGNYLLVHQFDAHAWAEVWIAGQGWVRVDPTAVISPSRVEQGIEQALQTEQSFLEDSPLSPARYRQIAWISQIRYGLDYINYAWHRSVLGYDVKTQRAFLSRFLNSVDIHSLGLWMVAAVALTLLLSFLALFAARLRYRKDPWEAAYQAFCHKMGRRQLPRQPGEDPQQYLDRLRQRWPRQRAQFEELTRLFTEGCYRRLSEQDKRRRLKRFRQLARRI